MRRQSFLQLGLLLVPLVTLPIAVSADTGPGDNPHLGLLVALLAAAGLPFFVVTTASPVLQRWFSVWGCSVAGPILPLRGRERRQPARATRLSHPDRAAADAVRAGKAVDGRLRRVRRPGSPLHVPVGRHRDTAHVRDGEGPGGSPAAGTPHGPPLDRNGRASVEPDGRNDELSLDGHRSRPVALGDSPWPLPAELRRRLREKLAPLAGNDQLGDGGLPRSSSSPRFCPSCSCRSGRS